MRLFKLSQIIILALVIGFASCKDDDEEDPIPAKFEIADTTNINYPVFRCTSDDIDNITYFYWNFGNSTYAYDSVVTAYYPFPGEYIVTLTVYSAGGTSTATDTITISAIDTSLTNDPYLRNLTFNPKGGNFSKRWVLSRMQGAITTGPSTALDTTGQNNYINDSIIETVLYNKNHFDNIDGCNQAYDNAMTFTLENYTYKNTDSAKWLVNWVFANNEFGLSRQQGNDVTIDITHALDTSGNYTLEFTPDSALFLSLTDKNFMLYYEGKPSKTQYQVLALRDDLLVVRKLYYNINGKPEGYRVIRYVPEELQNQPFAIPQWDENGRTIFGSTLKPPTK